MQNGEMEYWEFLIQQEGDHAWLPLESPDVEILEGRYRVAARSSYGNTATEIRITHDAIEEVPPKRRVQTRPGQTNREGLLVVFPFTWLRSGIWEIRCSNPDVGSGSAGLWHYTVRLQVLSKESEDWEPDWQPNPSATPPESVAAQLTPEQAVVSIADTPFPGAETPSPTATSPAREQWDQVAAEISYAATHPVPEEPNPDTAPLAAELDVSPADTASLESLESEPEPSPADALPLSSAPDSTSVLQLTLSQAAYMAHWGQALELTGVIEMQTLQSLDSDATDAIAPDHTPSADQLAPWSGELQICLRDPQSLQNVVETWHVLPISAPSVRFSCLCTIPETCKTRLLLGEIVLYANPTSSPERTALVAQSFTVTAALDELLNVLAHPETLGATEATTPELTDLPDLIDLDPTDLDLKDLEGDANLGLEPPQAEPEPSPPPERPRLDATFIDVAEAKKGQKPASAQPSTGQTLPPQIYRSDPAIASTQKPKLPVLPFIPSRQTIEPGVAEPDTDLEELTNSFLEELDEVWDTPLNPDTPQIPTVEADIAARLLDEELEPAPEDLSLADWDELTAVDPDLELPNTQSSLSDELLDDEPELAEAVSADELDFSGLEDFWAEAPPIAPESPVDQAFQSLRLQDRFWNRLNELASDPELPELLRTELDPANTLIAEDLKVEDDLAFDLQASDLDGAAETEEIEVLEAIEDAPNPDLPLSDWDDPEFLLEDHPQDLSADPGLVEPAPLPPQPAWKPVVSEMDDPWLAQEFVVEDDPPEVDVQSPPLEEVDLSLGAVLLDDELVPTPLLEMPSGELVAGELITVRVRLPNLLQRLYVKLWVQDLQTRSILDGPRWLTDFIPNGLGEIETSAQVVTPFGSLEVRFEAIAVETQTQRESHKVTIDRVIVPPNLPDLLLDEWDA